MYLIPEPSDQPEKALVIFYKVTKNIEYDNRLWDKRHFGRSMLAAQELIEVCGSYERAKRCIEELAIQYESKDLSWTLETIVKNSHDWLAKKERRNDIQNRQRFSDALAKQRASYATPGKGTSLTAGEALKSLGSLKIIQSHNGNQDRPGNTNHGEPSGGLQPDGMEAEEA